MDPQQTGNTPAPASSSPKIAIIAGILVVCLGAGIYLYTRPTATPSTSNQQTTTEQTPAILPAPAPAPTPVPTTPTPVATSTASAEAYKDGTYTAEGDYISPGGPEKISVTLTLSNDVVTDAQAQGEATNPISQRYQGKFISGFKSLVVGQKIANLQLSNVSGSSLTPHGFNDAVQKIKAQAQS